MKPLSNRKIILLITTTVVSLNLLVISLSCLSLLRSRGQYTEKAVITVTNLTQVLEQNLTGIISKADMGLKGLTNELERQLAAKQTDLMEIQDHIAVIRRSFPEIKGIRVIDSKGDTIYGMPSGMPAVNVSEREYFQKAKSASTEDLIISKPLFGKIDRIWLINLARRINNPDGSFAGVAYVSLPLQAISKLFSAVNVGEHGYFSLRDAQDLSLIVRYPEPDKIGSAVGSNNISQVFIKIWQTGASSGTYVASAGDARLRTWSFRKSHNGRYFIFAGLAKEDYLADWNQEALHTSVFLILFFLLTVLAGYVFCRNWKKSQAAEAAIRETEKRFKIIFDESPNIIALQEPETGAYIDVNQSFCEIRQTTKEELIGKTPDELGIMSSAEIKRLLEKFKRDGKLDHEEATTMNINGETTYVQVSSRFIETPAESYALSMIQDITARKLAEDENKRLMDQLLHSQKLESVGRLAGGIAHDFNNLLTPIIGYTEMLRGKMPEDDPGYAKTGHVLNAAHKAQSLVAQLLGFSRKQFLNIEQVDLNAHISAFLGILRRAIRENVDIQTRFNPEPCLTLADKNQFDQILMNLVVNSQDAIIGNGTITIETSNVHVDVAHARQHLDLLPGEYVVLAVSDTGHGMDKETQEKIFEPFFTTKDIGKGTGLGLATVYGLVKQQKGGIWVYSEPGRGTTFKIYFPAFKNVEAALLGPDQEVAVTYDGRGRTVLLVEDEFVVRELVREFLESMYFEVVVLADPLEAVEAANKSPFDLLLTDVIMPGLTGPELYQHLLRKQPGLKALFMSGYTGGIVEASGLTGQNSNYIQKPFTGNGLAAKIKQVLG